MARGIVSPRDRAMLVLGAFTFVLLVFGTAWYTFEQYERTIVQSKLAMTCREVALRAQSIIALQQRQLVQLEEMVDSGHVHDSDDFAEHARPLISTLYGVHSVTWIGDDGTVRSHVATDGEAGIAGTSVLDQPGLGAVYRRVQHDLDNHVGPTFTLPDGDLAVTAMRPHRDLESLGDDGPVDGYFAITFRVTPLLEMALAGAGGAFYQFEVYDDARLLMTTLQDDSAAATLSVSVPVAVGDRTWRVRATPSPGSETLFFTHADEVFLLVGLVIALGASLLIWRVVRVQSELIENQTRLAAAAEHLPGVVYTYDWDQTRGTRRLVYFGPGLAELVGPRQAAAVTASFDHMFELLHPHEWVRVRHDAGGVREGGTLDNELRLRCDDGQYRWVRSLARPVMMSGGIQRWHVMLIDIEEQRRATERQHLLVRELDHRVKNNLAAVLSLCDQTLASTRTREAFRQAFSGRIAALARTHEMLTSDRPVPLSIDVLVRKTITPYVVGDDDRVRLDGPARRLPSKIATSLALVLHELATNAVKHGALAKPEGWLDVCWSDGTGHLGILWQESVEGNGEDAMTEGFGLRLIRGLVERELQGSVELDFGPGGLRAEIQIPLAADRRDAASRAASPA